MPTGNGLADVWELRLLFDPTRLLIVKEGHVLKLPPGEVPAIRTYADVC
jgi:hypothetical protein